MDLWKKLLRKLRTLMRLSWGERLMILRAWVLLEVARIGLGCLGFHRCMRWLPRVPFEKAVQGSLTDNQRRRTRGIVRMVNAAARNGIFQPNCLRSSLVICYLVRRKGVPAEIQIGVRRDGLGLQAHAWVESDGVPINDAAEVSDRYLPFLDLSEALKSLDLSSRRNEEGPPR